MRVYGLGTTGGAVNDTGIAGFTLGGGIGWLMSQHGLACDNLVSADVVTADGTVLTASATEHPDLFWALRGGGGTLAWSPPSSISCIRWASGWPARWSLRGPTRATFYACHPAMVA